MSFTPVSNTNIPQSSITVDDGFCLKNSTIRRTGSLVMIILACLAAYFSFYYGNHFGLAPQNNLVLRNLFYTVGCTYIIAALANGIYACIGCDKNEKEDKKGDLFYYDPTKAAAQFSLTLFAPVVFAGSLIAFPIFFCTQLPACQGKSGSQVQ